MSTANGPARPANQILSALPEAEYARLIPGLQPVSFCLGDVLYHPGDPIRYVYFINNALVSLLITLEGGESVEVGVIGREGMLGFNYALGSRLTPHLAVAQIPGDTLRMKSDAFKTEFDRGLVLHDILMSFTGHLLAMVSQTVACNRVHYLDKRLARWILLVRERVASETFPMTHEFISRMLGTPRSEVSLAAGVLRRKGLIKYSYGRITVLDQAALEMACCECYRSVKDIYAGSLDGRAGKPDLVL